MFFDPTGRPRRRVRLAMLGTLLVLLLASVIFATTVLNVPAAAPLPIGYERNAPLPFRAQVSRLKHRFTGLFRQRPVVAANTGKGLTIAFYAVGMDDGQSSLARHVDQVDWLAPTLLHLDPAGQLVSLDDPTLRRVVANAMHRPLVVPVIQNIAA